MLDILDKRGIKATFFFVGQYVRANPEQVREVVRRGHNVASHSWSHPTYLRRWAREARVIEVRRSYAALGTALADAPPDERARIEPMFRFPGLGEGAFMADWLILHETRPQMIQALPGILDGLTARGFSFVQITAGPEGREQALAAGYAVLTLQ